MESQKKFINNNFVIDEKGLNNRDSFGNMTGASQKNEITGLLTPDSTGKKTYFNSPGRTYDMNT